MMTIESPGAFWKDYELIDSGNFEKLERFGPYIMARPEPKALWDKSLSEGEWNRMIHTKFKIGAGFGKAGKEDSGTWERRKKMDDQWYIRYNGVVHNTGKDCIFVDIKAAYLSHGADKGVDCYGEECLIANTNLLEISGKPGKMA